METRLTELATVFWSKAKRAYACSCGRRKVINRYDVTSGKTRSCGCLDNEKRIARNLKHGMAARGQLKPPEYIVWQRMLSRCYQLGNRCFDIYGGRGITVCDRWRDNFGSFLSDMGPRPTAKHQLDRVDNSGNYEPSNCRWVTASENARNRRPKRWYRRPVTA